MRHKQDEKKRVTKKATAESKITEEAEDHRKDDVECSSNNHAW